jgi:exosortase
MESLTEHAQSHTPTALVARRVPWVAVAWFGILLIGTFFPILRKLVSQWSYDEDVGHGFFVPIVAGFIAWQRRDTLMNLDWKAAWWGVGLIALGGVQAYIGMLGAELFLQRTAFLEALLGVLLVLGGTALVRALLFPLLLLPFMIPIPAVIYNQITFPLQLFASSVAETVLNAIGIPVLRDGNILELASQKLSVVEACSGIRSLLTLTFLSLVYAYAFDKKVWMRWALLAITIPIAILANAGRVTITGILSEIDTKLANGIFHEMEGWVIFAIAFGMLVVAHWLVNWIYGIRHEPEVLPSNP